MGSWTTVALWQAVASELRVHRSRGLGALLTEDTVRFAAIRAIVESGGAAADLRVEAAHPSVKGARIDLTAGGNPPTAVIEFKYPREPREKNAAWTMVRGEVLKDFYRLAAYPGDVDRLFVYAESSRLRQYMTRATTKDGLDIHSPTVTILPSQAARLPSTALQIIGTELSTSHVTAHRLAEVSVDDDLKLLVFRVDGLERPPSPTATQAVAAAENDPVPVLEHSAERRTPSTALTARSQILSAAAAIASRTGRDTFSPAEVVAELRRAGSALADSTIRTMITSHMCAEAPVNAGTTYDDLQRVGRGQYRLRR